jgi:hypothetical protein
MDQADLLSQSSLQQQLCSFLQQPNSQPLRPPGFLNPNSPLFPFIVLERLLPLMLEVEAGRQQKKMVAGWLEQLILNSADCVDKLESVLRDPEECQGDGMPLGVALIRLVGVPAKYVNLISEENLFEGREVTIQSVEAHSTTLYQVILRAAAKLEQEERLTVVNKLIVLGHCGVVLQDLL